MPVELPLTSVERALALLGEHDLEAPGDVEAVLDLIAARDDADAPVEVSRYDLQLFLWYQLPCKLLAPPEVKRQVAARLGRFLAPAGEGAERYAELVGRVHAVIVAEGWNAVGESPAAHDVSGCAWGLFRPAEALGLLVHHYEYDREMWRARDELRLAPGGRETLRLALRARAAG